MGYLPVRCSESSRLYDERVVACADARACDAEDCPALSVAKGTAAAPAPTRVKPGMNRGDLLLGGLHRA